MDCLSPSSSSSSQPFIVAVAFTFFCFAIAVFSARFSHRRTRSFKLSGIGNSLVEEEKKRRNCDCNCSCKGAVVTGETSAEVKSGILANGKSTEMFGKGTPVAVEKQTGASMMEQLVPEITTHALSYLDYPSLCRLSMTNSLMRKAANDDNAWKALYHKDFTMEQSTVKPPNGWKAYYAATRSIMNVNAQFFNTLKERSLPAMSRLWLNADYVKCFHASGECFTGYTDVMQSWQIVFNWEQQGNNIQIVDIRARVFADVAWVTMKAYVGQDAVPYNVTNVFEYHNGKWYMVHHHCSVMLVDGVVDQQMVHA